MAVEQGPWMVIPWTQAVEPGFRMVDWGLGKWNRGLSNETRGSDSGAGCKRDKTGGSGEESRNS